MVTALISALPLLFDTLIVLMFFFMIFAIAGVQLFSGQLKKRCIEIESGIPHYDLMCGYTQCPGDAFLLNGALDISLSKYFCGKTNRNLNYGATNFDNVLYSILIIFETVTMQGWTSVMEYLEEIVSPYVVIYFVPIVLIGSFFLLNLPLAVINSKFNDTHKEAQKKQNKAILHN